MKDGTQVQQHCQNSIWPSRLANLLFHSSSSELLAVSSLAWQVWHSGVSGSLFLFYVVSCSHASYNWNRYVPALQLGKALLVKKRRLRASRDASFSVTTLSLMCVSSKPSPADEEHSSCFNKFWSKPRVPSCAGVSYCNSAYDNDRWLTIFLDIAGFCSPEVQKEPNSTAAVKTVTVNCAPWTQLALRLHPRHCDTNIFPMSQSAKYNPIG